MTKLSIIILSYNTKELLLKCLASVFSHYKRELEEGKFEIIIVDNKSTDGSIERIKNEELGIKHSKLKIIENNENVGFAKGVNIGAKIAKGEYLLFLNSDTELKDNNFISMINLLEKNSKIGILGARMANQDGSPQASSGKFYNFFNAVLMIMGAERLSMLRSIPTKIQEVDWVSGGAMMVKKDLFVKLCGFDEGYFMYFEDMDLCFRAKTLGFLTYFYPSIEILHRQHGSSNKEYAILNIYKGISYFYRNRKPYWQYLIIKSLLRTKAILALFAGATTGNSYLKSTYKKALAI